MKIKERLVIGFYVIFPSGLTEKYNLTEEEFINSKIGGFHIGKVMDISNNKIDEVKIISTNKNYNYINNIGMSMTMYDTDTGLTKFEFNKSIPENIIKDVIKENLIYKKD